jgi:acylphosphatase
MQRITTAPHRALAGRPLYLACAGWNVSDRRASVHTSVIPMQRITTAPHRALAGRPLYLACAGWNVSDRRASVHTSVIPMQRNMLAAEVAIEAKAHVWVSGHVQGVWFRSSLRDEASRRQVRGWARNLDDGRVEAMFAGPEDQVRAVVDWCRVGPPDARVDGVEVDWNASGDDVSGGERGFAVR